MAQVTNKRIVQFLYLISIIIIQFFSMRFCVTVTTYYKFYKFCDFCIKKDNLRFSRWAAFFHVIVLKQVFVFVFFFFPAS